MKIIYSKTILLVIVLLHTIVMLFGQTTNRDYTGSFYVKTT